MIVGLGRIVMDVDIKYSIYIYGLCASRDLCDIYSGPDIYRDHVLRNTIQMGIYLAIFNSKWCFFICYVSTNIIK